MPIFATSLNPQALTLRSIAQRCVSKGRRHGGCSHPSRPSPRPLLRVRRFDVDTSCSSATEGGANGKRSVGNTGNTGNADNTGNLKSLAVVEFAGARL